MKTRAWGKLKGKKPRQAAATANNNNDSLVPTPLNKAKLPRSKKLIEPIIAAIPLIPSIKLYIFAVPTI
jgi:hypothetical protein